MDKKIPDHWQRVEWGMGGVFIERNVKNLSGSIVKADRLDVIHVPAWNLNYEVDAGHFSNDSQIQTAVSMYGFGVSKGIEIGKEQAREEIRKALGLPVGKDGGR